MKSPMSLASRVLIAAVAFVSAWGIAGYFFPTLTSAHEWQVPETSTHERQRAALKEGGLAAAAAVTGSFATSVSYGSVGGPAYLNELASLSPIILVGSAEDNVCRLTSDGKSIETVYSVRVESVLKGQFDPGAVLTVTVPGGRANFPGKGWAQVDTPGFLAPQPSGRYVWFLKSSSHPSAAQASVQTFELSQGPLGLYDLSPSRPYVVPAGNAASPLFKGLSKSRLTSDQFISAVKNARNQ